MTAKTLVVSVPTESLAAAIEPVPAGVELVIWPMKDTAPRNDIDLVVPPYMGSIPFRELLSGLSPRLIQSQSIGYEGIADQLPSGAAYANAATVHEASTAELAVGLAIAAQRDIAVYAVNALRGHWQLQRTRGLADSRVLVLGYGGVGKAVAARLRPFEVDVVPVASRARVEDGVNVHGIEELPTLLPSADIVVLTLPGGDATHHIIGDAELSALPDGALVVNVGRGPLIDTEALVDHVGRGRIRAALDVTDPEPMPSDHPLWTMPGVLISPHAGGATDAMRPRVVALIRRQIERILAGEEPVNIVIS